MHGANGTDAGTLEEFTKYLEGSKWKLVNSEASGSKGYQQRCCGYQGYGYFHPFVRRFWYDAKMVARFERKDIKALHVLPSGEGMPTEPVRFNVKECELLRFNPDIGILHLAIEFPLSPSAHDSAKKLPLNVVQACLDQVRRIYPPYFDEWEDREGKLHWQGGHYPLDVRLIAEGGEQVANGILVTREKQIVLLDEARTFRAETDSNWPLSYLWAAHWQYLLAPLITAANNKDGFHAIQLGDDRGGVASYIAFENLGHLKALDRGNWVRLCFADAPGTDVLPYSQRQLKDFEERFCYDRFWYAHGESTDNPSRVLNCGYAFTWAGWAGDEKFFSNIFNGAPAIFEEIYVPMAIIAHFQKASLLAASARLSELSRRKPDGTPEQLDTEKFEKFYRHFIAFTQTYWFDEISPQEQAIQLFGMYRTHLRIPDLYAEVRQELQDAMALINTQIAQEQGVEAHQLTRIATLIALPALVATIVSMFAAIFALKPAELPVEILYGQGTEWGNSLIVFNLLIVFSLIALVLATVLLGLNLKTIKKTFNKSGGKHHDQ